MGFLRGDFIRRNVVFRLIFERDFKSGDFKFCGSPNADQKGRIGKNQRLK